MFQSSSLNMERSGRFSFAENWTVTSEYHNRPTSIRSSGERKGKESVAKAVSYLSNKGNYPFIRAITETAQFSSLDREGIDLVCELDPAFDKLVGLGDTLCAQIKSSEMGVQLFFKEGVRIAGRKGGNWWREQNLLILNGQWPEEQFNGDVVAQMIRLLGIPGFELEIQDFLSVLPRSLADQYIQASQNGLYAHRQEMLDWMFPPIDM